MWLCGEAKRVIHLSTSINGDGWVDVIFGEKAPLSDWRNGRITTSTNYGILVMDFDGDGSSIYWILRFYFLLPPKPSPIFTFTLSLVQTFGNFPSCCTLKIYVRPYREIFYNTYLSYMDSFQIILIDSIRVGFDVSDRELKFVEKGGTRTENFEIYDVLGRKVKETRSGIYFFVERRILR